MARVDTSRATQSLLVKQQDLLAHEKSPALSHLSMWDLVTSSVSHVGRDAHFWWTSTGIPFATLLHKAGYPIEAQFQHLLFYYTRIAPELGPAPVKGASLPWKSFMTDHFSPVELSWEWGRGGDIPIVRFSFEPIGPNAGTSLDQLNRYAAIRLVRQYQNLLPGCDLQLFDHFYENLIDFDQHTAMDERILPNHQGHQSRTFLAFDLGVDSVILKAYFIPTFKATQLGISTWSVISDAIQNIPGYSPSLYPGWNVLEDFVARSSYTSGLEAEIFAIDCVAPARSRLKLYMRSRSTSLASVEDVMTLGGLLLNDPGYHRCLTQLRKLWNLVLSLEGDFHATKQLRTKAHRTAGILYYFDVKQGEAVPGVKLYIPVRHYGRDDLSIVDGLTTYLRSRGQCDFARKYLEALEEISSASALQRNCGLQTYLGSSFVEGELKLTSYIAPQVHNLAS